MIKHVMNTLNILKRKLSTTDSSQSTSEKECERQKAIEEFKKTLEDAMILGEQQKRLTPHGHKEA